MEGHPNPNIKELLFQKHSQTMKRLHDLSVRDKRKLFSIIRKCNKIQHLNLIFGGTYGFTLGEFCTEMTIGKNQGSVVK